MAHHSDQPVTLKTVIETTSSPSLRLGTGKTESVKALGNALGRFVLVFNCDEAFDFQAMGRIFVGLCQVGAWGCFDEFNRLEERMLSAVSQQIQTIQEALRQQSASNKSRRSVNVEHVDVLCLRHAEDRNRRQDDHREFEHGHFHHDESWLRWPLEPARQSEDALPKLGDDRARQGSHRASDALLPRLSSSGDSLEENRSAVHLVERTTIESVALRFRPTLAEERAGDGR